MMTVPQLTPHGLPPQGFPLSSLLAKSTVDSEDVEYPSSPERNSRPSHGSLPGGLRIAKRVGRGMTAQPKGNTIMAGCLTEIARGNGMRNYVNEPLLGSMNQHLSCAFLRLLLQLRIGMVIVMTPLICPQHSRPWLTTCWTGARTRHPGSTARVP